MYTKSLVGGCGVCLFISLVPKPVEAQVIIDSSSTRRYINESSSYACRPQIAVEPNTGNLAIAFIRLVPNVERTLMSAISVDRGQSWNVFEDLDQGVARDNRREITSVHMVATAQSPVIVWEERERPAPEADSLQYLPVVARDLGGWNAGNWKNTIIDSSGAINNVLQTRYVNLAIAPDNPNLWGIAAYHRRQPVDRPGEYVMYYRSTDAGASWSRRLIVAYRRRLTIPTDSTKAVGDIIESSGAHVTLGPQQTGLFAFVGELTEDDTLANPIYCMTTDGGQTWTAPARVPGTEVLQCAFGSDAPGYLTTFQDGDGNWHIFTIGEDTLAQDGVHIYHLKLVNGSWQQNLVPTPPLYPAGLLFGYYSKSSLHLALAGDKTIYLAYTYLTDTTGVELNPQTATQKIDVYLVKSTDGGDTWSEPTNVTNTPNLAEDYVSLASVVTMDGMLHLTYTVSPFGAIGPWYLYYHSVPRESIGTQVAERADKEKLPQGYTLLQNIPNPFATNTTITFQLQQADKVRLSVFNALAQEVEVLVDMLLPSGRHQLNWPARDLPSGVYFLRIRLKDGVVARKILLLR